MISPVLRMRLAALGLAIGVIALTGCSGGSKVEGTVMYKGAPVEGAMVEFVTEDGKTAGQGQTDKSGKYRLATPQGKDGVASGNYIVLVTKTSAGGPGDVINPADGADKMKAMMMKGKANSTSVLPLQFSDKAKSTLKKTVPSGDYNLDLGS